MFDSLLHGSLHCPEVSSGVNPELNQHVLLKDAKILKKMMASQKLDLKLHERKLRLGPRPKLKPPVGEELIVPAEDRDFEDHRLFESGKHHHLNYLEEQNNLGKMAEVDRDPEVLLLDHLMHLFVDFVKVVTEVKAERLNFEDVQDGQVHSVQNPLDLLQLLPQPTVLGPVGIRGDLATVGWVWGEFRSSENKSFGFLRLIHDARTITCWETLKQIFFFFFKKIPKFSINFFRNSNVSLELKQKEKLGFLKKIGGKSSQRIINKFTLNLNLRKYGRKKCKQKKQFFFS
jgi:hypothetical protein